MLNRNAKLPAAWQAKWIDPEPEHDRTARQPASVLRRRFTLSGTEHAVLYITCHGLYEAVLNGRRVGDFVLAPGTGDCRKRLAVQAYDVSALLRIAEDVAGAVHLHDDGGLPLAGQERALGCLGLL